MVIPLALWGVAVCKSSISPCSTHLRSKAISRPVLFPAERVTQALCRRFQRGNIYPEYCGPAYKLYYAEWGCTMGTNLIATGMIAYKAWYVHIGALKKQWFQVAHLGSAPQETSAANSRNHGCQCQTHVGREDPGFTGRIRVLVSGVLG